MRKPVEVEQLSVRPVEQRQRRARTLEIAELAVKWDDEIVKGTALPEPTLTGYRFPNPLDERFFKDIPDKLARRGTLLTSCYSEPSCSPSRATLTTSCFPWETGVDGAQAGVVVAADPTVGLSYRQEYYAGHAEDAATILSLDEQVRVPYGHFNNVLLTKDYSNVESRVLEYKFYALGVGPVEEIAISGGSDQIGRAHV